MANEEKIEIRLIGRADTKEFADAANSLLKVDKATAGAVDSTKRLAEAQKQLAKDAANAQRELKAALGTPRVNPSSTLASTFLKSPKSATELREAEKQAGLRTERSMAAEDRQRTLAADRRRKFLEDARRQRFDTTDRTLHGPGEDSGGPSLLDTIKGVRASTAATFGAIAGAATFAAKAVREYARAQEASASVDAALAQRGVLLEDVRQKVHGIAQALSQRTTLSKDHWLQALTPLLQSGANVENLDELGRVLENIAGLMNGNLSRASTALSKALVGNFENLREIGIVLPEGASQMQKWAAVVEQSARGSGQLAARSQTLSGQFDAVKNAAGGLFGVVGRGIASFTGLSFWMGLTGSAANALARALGGTTPPAILMNNSLQTSSQRLQDVQAAAQQAARDFDSVHAAANRATDAFNRQRSAAEQLRAAQDTLADAQLQLQLARIDARERGGHITRERAVLERAGARSSAQTAQFQRAQAFDTQTISASERALNQMGTQRGLAEGEQASAQTEFDRQQQAHAARGAAANAQIEVQRVRNRLAQEETASALAGASDIDSPSEIGRRAIAARAASQTSAELTAAEQRAADAQRHAQSFGPEMTDANLAGATERLATAAEKLQQTIAEIEQRSTRLQDDISSSRLSRDTRASRFGIDQQREGVEVRSEFGQARGAPAQTVTVPANNNEQLIGQLRQALVSRESVLRAGFADIVRDIDADIRSLRQQIRNIANRR